MGFIHVDIDDVIVRGGGGDVVMVHSGVVVVVLVSVVVVLVLRLSAVTVQEVSVQGGGKSERRGALLQLRFAQALPDYATAEIHKWQRLRI